MEMHLARQTDSALDNAEAVRGFITALAKAANMTIVNGPTVHVFEQGIPSANGLSAFAIIAESHIAIHTWPELHHVWLDIVSCKPFDVASILFVMDKYIPNKRMGHCVIDEARGQILQGLMQNADSE